jgi:RNA polymerase sigma factor (sigma-70 family)
MTDDLIDRFLRGDSQAEAEMVRFCDPFLRRLAVAVYLKRGGRNQPRVDAEDLYSDAILHLFDHRARIFGHYDRARELGPFLYTVLRNCMWDVMSKDLRRSQDPPPTDARTEVDPVEAIYAALDADVVIAEVLERVDGVGRQVFTSMFLDGLDDDTISARLGMRKSNVHVWRCRLLRLVAIVAAELGVRRAPTPPRPRRPSGGAPH